MTTQKDRVLKMLRSAGKAGVRSDVFLGARIPRAAARVLELRQEGYEITAERERQFCRYKLRESAGVGAGNPPLPSTASAAQEGEARLRPSASVNPGGSSLPGRQQTRETGEPPTLFDQGLAA